MKRANAPTFLHGILHSSDVCNYTGTMIYGMVHLWTSSLEREKHQCSDVLSLVDMGIAIKIVAMF